MRPLIQNPARLPGFFCVHHFFGSGRRPWELGLPAMGTQRPCGRAIEGCQANRIAPVVTSECSYRDRVITV